MQLQVDIEFEQLVQIAKKLPAKQWLKLKTQVEAKPAIDEERAQLKKLLLGGPPFSKKQLGNVAETRNASNKWRTK